jgi:hypothetical protein
MGAPFLQAVAHPECGEIKAASRRLENMLTFDCGSPDSGVFLLRALGPAPVAKAAQFRAVSEGDL